MAAKPRLQKAPMEKDDESFGRQYRHPNWQKKRLHLFDAADWKCQGCGENTKELHAHHINYEPGIKVWDYPDENFRVYCKECHNAAGEAIRRFRQATSIVCPRSARVLSNAVLFAAAHLSSSGQIYPSLDKWSPLLRAYSQSVFLAPFIKPGTDNEVIATLIEVPS